MLANAPAYRQPADSALLAMPVDLKLLQQAADGYACGQVPTSANTLIAIVLRGFASADPSVQSQVIKLGAKAPVARECPDEDT